MLGIPFISLYIKRIVRVQSVADSVDWLNYYCSSLMLAFFSLAISAKQYFGSPIQCWTPNEFKGGWDRYAEDYCFIANSYYVPPSEEVPSDLALREDRISYYRWVPIVLAIQALLFWLPNWLWNMLHKQTAVNPRAVINEALPARQAHGQEREKEIERLAHHIIDTLDVFKSHQNSGFCHFQLLRSGYSATFLYLGIKLLYLMNVIGQLLMLNQFLGGDYHLWSFTTLDSLLKGEEWRESPIFPRVIMCDFTIRRLANPQRHTVQCVLMMNMINEKLYLFLHFWLMIVGVVTFVNFFYYLVVLSTPLSRRKFVAMNINKREHKARGMRSKDINRFVELTLRADGVLLLQFVRQHVGGRVTYDLLNELLRIYWAKNHCAASASTHQTGTGSEAKGTPLSSPGGGVGDRPGSERYRAFSMKPKVASLAKPSAPPTYKPTLYGPAGLYPGGCEDGIDLIDANNAQSSFFGSPIMERATPIPSIDEAMDEMGQVSMTPSQAGTLPLKELRVKSAANGHIYAPGPHSPRTPNGKNSPHLLNLSRGNSPITTHRSFTNASPRMANTIYQTGPNGSSVTVSKNASNV